MKKREDLARLAADMKLQYPNMSAAEIATSLGSTKDKVQKWIKGIVSVRAPKFVKLPAPLKLVGDYLVLGDLHSVTLNKQWFIKAIAEAKSLGIKGVVLAGDLFCFDKYSKYPQVSHHPGLSAELGVVSWILQQCGHFETIAILTGNHDERLMSHTRGDIDMQLIINMLGLPDAIRANIIHTTDNWCWLKSGKAKWMITHAYEYSKNPGFVGNRIAMLERCNVVQHHQHNAGFRMSDDGAWTLIDNGGMCDASRTSYHQSRISGKFRKWDLGYCLIIDGVAHPRIKSGLIAFG